MKRIKVAQFGLGAIGVEALKFAAQQPWLDIVGAVDNDPAKSGRALTEITGLGQLDGLRVTRDLEALFRETPPEVILHTASSSAAATFAQMRPALEFGVSVASTCEQLIFPALKEPVLTKEYDALCRHTGARVAAAGVNPGFVMDVLPIALTSVSRRVESIFVGRVVNASTRRRALQEKIGCGAEPEEFSDRLRSGRAGHAGLIESAALIAHAMCWTLESLTEEGEPVLAERTIATPFFTVPQGKVCGIRQRVVGVCDGVERIVLELAMHLDAPRPRDRVVVRGEPPLDLTIEGGVAGDAATVAALINVVPRLLAAAPGLRLATDLALPKWAVNS